MALQTITVPAQGAVDGDVRTLATETAALRSDIASAAAGKGASCVGLEDLGGLYAAATVEAALAEAKAVQQATGVMVAGSVTFAAFTLRASSVVIPIKEIEDPAASGVLTVGAITPGTPGSVTITSANGAETSTVRAVVLG